MDGRDRRQRGWGCLKEVTKIKRHDNLFEQIANFDNLHEAYREASKGKHFKRGTMEMGARAEIIISDIEESLWTGEWQPSKYYEFELRTEIKRRLVAAPSFVDCVVQHAILRQVQDFFERKMIFDSYANRKLKGAHKAVDRLRHFLQAIEEPVYVLQGDVHHYFPSIDHEILKRDISRTIKDKLLLETWCKIIDGYNGDTGRGIPIGAPISQLEAGVYLTPFDHFVKETLRKKYYIRLMDDFIILDTDKARLKSNLDDIRWYLDTQRHLKLNKKTRIYPTKQGIDFGGYRTWRTHTLPRKRNMKAAKKRFDAVSWLYREHALDLDDALARVSSFLGYVAHCDAYKSTGNVMKHLHLQREG